jgi:Uma2 family endonuclease
LYGVDWSRYLRIGRLLEDHNVRMTYLDGRLEIVCPSAEHEGAKELFALVIRQLAWALGLSTAGFASTTFQRRPKSAGKEPDTCFYLGENARRMFRKKKVDLRRDPPPDLAVEVVVHSRDTVALETYARLGVPEVWWYEDGTLTVHRLGADGRYVESPTSGAFRGLRPEAVEDWIDTPAGDEFEWINRVQGLIAAEAARLRQPGD